MKHLSILAAFALTACQTTIDAPMTASATTLETKNVIISGMEFAPTPAGIDYSKLEGYVYNRLSQPGTNSFQRNRRKTVDGVRTSYYIPDDWTDITSPLADIKVPADWRLVDNYEEYMRRANQARKMVGHIVDANKCGPIVGEWYLHTQSWPYQTALCGNTISIAAIERNYAPLETAIEMLYEDGMYPLNNHDGQFIHSYGQLIFNIAVPYVLHRDKLNLKYSKTDIDNWLRDRVDNVEMINLDTANNTLQPRCHPTKMARISVFVDDCNDTRTKIVIAKLVMGLHMQDQKLFDEGVEGFHYLSQFYDAQGVYMGTAFRGGKALDYSQAYMQLIPMFVEIFATVDYDLLGHRMPNGMTYAEIISFNFDMLWSSDVSPVIPYAKLAIGQKGSTWRDIVGGKSVYDKSSVMYFNSRWSKYVGRAKGKSEEPFVDQILDTNAMHWVNR